MGCWPGFRAVAFLVVVLGISTLSFAQKSPEQTVAGLHVPADWNVTLYASEPMITNPTAIDIDTQGRVWVCEGQWYRSKAKDPPADCVKVLEDTDGDGRADKATVFADGLTVPMSVAVAGTRVYVGESPNLWVCEDKNGDLKADPGSKKALLTGFNGVNSDHGLHGLMLGPDHCLYMTQGDSGLDVTGPDGARGRPVKGSMLRCELDGTRFEVLADNFRNPYEITVDSFGNAWCSDNDSDGDKAVRICWILEGGNYGWYGRGLDVRSLDGTYDPVNEWRTPIPGHVPSALITGFGSPAGIAFYEYDLLGAKYQNGLLHTDAGPRELRVYHRERRGAGFVARQETVLTGDDSYFRPVDVCVAPDGSIYVADWYDEGVGGHAYNNPTQGRIYRITPKGVAFHRPGKPGPYTNHADAMDALASPNLATQFLARQRLLQEGAKAAHSLAKVARAGEPTTAARALWLLDRIEQQDPGHSAEACAALDAALKDPRPEFRALAVRILRRHQPVPLDRVLPVAKDSDSQVRREVLLALRTVSRSIAKGGQAKGGTAGVQTPPNPPLLRGGEMRERDALLALIRAWDGQDRFYLETIGSAAGDRGPALFDDLKLGDPQNFNRRTIKLLQVLHPPKNVERLVSHLNDKDLDPALASDIVDALGWMTEPEAMRAVATAMSRATLPMEARKLAVQRIRRRIHSDYKPLARTRELREGLRAALAENDLRIDALGLIGDGKMAALDEAAAQLLKSSDDRTTQSAAIAALGGLDTPRARAALAEAAAHPPTRLASQALKALAQMRGYHELEKLLLGSSLATELKQETVHSIGRNADGLLFLMTLIDDNKLEGALRDQAIRLGLRHPDVNVRQVYARFAPAASQPATVAQLNPQRILSLPGDADHGHSLFTQGAAKCTTCHRVGLEGADVGPELTLIGLKYGPPALLDQIVRPAAAVAPEFTPYVLESQSRGFVVGFLVRKTGKEVEFKATDGERFTVPADDVQSLQKQPGTVMPDLLLETFKEQDVADLLAYLASLKTVPQQIKEWMVAGPFPARDFHRGYDTVYGPEERLDLTAHYDVPDGTAVVWKHYKPPVVEHRYAVELEKLTSAGRKDSVIYLYVPLDSPQAQSATLDLQSDAAVKAFLNGKVVFGQHRHELGRKKPLRIVASLESGHNDLLLKLEHAGGDGRFLLHLETAEPVTALLP